MEPAANAGASVANAVGVGRVNPATPAAQSTSERTALCALVAQQMDLGGRGQDRRGQVRAPRHADRVVADQPGAEWCYEGRVRKLRLRTGRRADHADVWRGNE